MPHCNRICQRQERKNESLYHGDGLLENQKPAAVPSVGKNPREGGNYKHWQLRRECDNSQQKRRPCDAVDEPCHRDLLHPGADERDSLSDKKESEVSVPKRTEEKIRP